MTYDATKMPAGVAEGEAKCEPDELITGMNKYFEGVKEQGGEITEEDKALLKDMYEVFQKETVPGDKKAEYSKLMALLGDAKYMEGIDISSLETADQAKILESRDEFLDAARITGITTPEGLKKKKELLEKAEEKYKGDTEKLQEVATEYVAVNDEESLKEAFKLFSSAPVDDMGAAVRNVLLIDGGKNAALSNDVAKEMIKTVASAKKGHLVDSACAEYGLYDELIDTVYALDADANVKLDLILGGQIDAQKVIDFLKDKAKNPRKTKEFELEDQSIRDTFYTANKSLIDNLTSGEKELVEERLGLKDTPVAEQAEVPEPAPDQASEPVSETPKDSVAEKTPPAQDSPASEKPEEEQTDTALNALDPSKQE